MSSLKKILANRYPLLVLIAIPVLMSIGTYWNLRSFNRDMNSLLRSQAVSLAESIFPLLKNDILEIKLINQQLESIKANNTEIYSAAILQKKGEEFTVYTATDQNASIAESGLNQLALGFDQAVAGLVYDPNLGDTVWNVVVPTDSDEFLFVLQLRTDSVKALLERTARDSLIILLVIVSATLVVFINHLIFYKRSLEATKLKELDQLKDEFISMAAHELRAPVTGLVGYLSLIKMDIEGGRVNEINENLSILDSLTNNLNSLIDDLLNVSRIEQGRLSVNPKDTDINKLLEEVVDTYKIHAEQKGLLLNLKSDKLPNVQSDQDRLRQVISNLVSNAVKYTIKGSVEVVATQKAKSVEIQIKDTGVGIPPEHMQKLFSKFFRVKDEKTSEVPGTGLGLWISKQIIELLGGNLYVESIYGTGSVFTITLPL